ncbi:hypothetical protein Nepgr_011785 [Nepenthes gracilis]|uniref:non-specific serine/threonine protein kinase n=1 Tax=Nepenthes gracilis TaxID=150966 RepID=A0AAD3XML1_NEPGR|nr:hypothetical protein Nepgr_011785 [Nepenthes gracilis]
MGSFPGNCEIVDVKEEEPHSSEHPRCINRSKSETKTGRHRRSLTSNSGRVSTLEDDLNQLFEIFNRRAASHGLAHPYQAGASPSRKYPLKQPGRGSGSYSPRFETSERLNLKQALRGLCISQASEMAATKRSAKSGGRSSEAGRILTMYHNVVEDATILSEDEVTGSMPEISLVPEDCTVKYVQKEETPELKESPSSRPSHGDEMAKTSKKAVVQNGMIFTSTEISTQASSFEISKKEKHAALPASSFSPVADLLKMSKICPRENTIFSESEASTPPSHCRDGNNTLEVGKGKSSRKEMISASTTGCCQTPTMEDRENFWELSERSPAPVKSINKEITAKSAKTVDKGSRLKAGKKGSLETLPSTISTHRNKISKPTRNALYFVKPAIKTKIFVKKKHKKDLSSVSNYDNTCAEVNDGMCQVSNQIVCPRCHCVLTKTSTEVGQDSPVSPFECLGTDNLKKSKAVIEARDNSRSREKGGFTQSSKSSPSGCSSSTSISEESNLSRPSCCDRPHMSKDVRWQAIQHIKKQHGKLGLNYFNLLKKLGCGDIGTVYLAELAGTSCLFAIKVMDNDFLARRKKISRAQTEKEILRMLDHPFLPTLYCQFTSDNLSCLVMEYCPGGDLHVLRQRQPGGCFTEQAARFYVAEVLLALEYLHMLGVVYRDLKPENILVREDGHIMLSDFDLSLRCAVNPMLLVSPSMAEATNRTFGGPCGDSGCVQPLCMDPSFQVSCFSPRLQPPATKPRKPKSESTEPARPLPLLVAEPTTARSNSFVGTHEYLAPEIVKGEGHGSAVDWWTFGVFLYELLYGRTPFKGSGNEETLVNVALQSLKFPDSPLVSFQARDLIAALLVKEPENRLGTERGSAEIKQHPFFEGLNWALIRCAVPPELPEPPNFEFIKSPSHEKGIQCDEHNSSPDSEFEVF